MPIIIVQLTNHGRLPQGPGLGERLLTKLYFIESYLARGKKKSCVWHCTIQHHTGTPALLEVQLSPKGAANKLQKEKKPHTGNVCTAMFIDIAKEELPCAVSRQVHLPAQKTEKDEKRKKDQLLCISLPLQL